MAYQIARRELLRDFNLVTLLRDIRFTKSALKYLLGGNDYLVFKQRARKKRLIRHETKVRMKGESTSEIDTDPLSSDSDNKLFNNASPFRNQRNDSLNTKLQQ